MAKEFIVKKTQFDHICQGHAPSQWQELLNAHVEQVILCALGQDEFTPLKIFALGSFGLRKLCPYSDIDLLILGDTERVRRFSEFLEKDLKHLKIRHIPYEKDIDYSLWLKDVNIFDHYSLLYARAFRKEDEGVLERFWQEVQKPHIQENKEQFLKQVLEEKQRRSQRYGNVDGLLQPNIKYGRGGLRDITQALGWLTWWDQGVVLHTTVRQRLLMHYDLLSRLRFTVHMLHDNDYISADMWPEVLKGFAESYAVLELQKKIHKTFNAVKVAGEYIFFSDEFYNSTEQSEFASGLNFSVLDQKLKEDTLSFRDSLELRLGFQPPHVRTLSEIEKSLLFTRLHEKFLGHVTPRMCGLLFDSFLIPQLLPHWDTIAGRPQSGHYHQYTVDQHLLKTLEAVCQIQSKEINMFGLTSMTDTFKPEDWQMLKWVSLFHDLAKGLPGDHSEVGADIVTNEIHCELWSEKFKQDISDMVRYHLVLSKSAFRYDHNDAENLQQLYSKLKSYKFFKLLTVFTAADIMASNPEAWNEWKSDQFYLLSESFRAFINNGQVSTWLDIEGFQILVTLSKKLGESLLKEDLLSLDKDPQGLNIKVIQHEFNIWIRACDRDEGPGVLVKMLNLFFQAGLSIEQAFICGNEKRQVAYNWFRLPLKTSKSAQEIERTLKTLMKRELTASEIKVSFESIKCLSDVDNKWVFLFKGRDQKGLLLRVTQVFAKMNLNILKAQVSTWGESVEDVFVVEQRQDLSLEEALESLRQELMNNYWH
ncbi:MAG: ACT domain-containing protein [Bdellovibrionaceae bacterium]|nr:ACT domain-containing protein [Pseudobdellovibrionaceae bacterium]